jgi:hypothetical protein
MRYIYSEHQDKIEEKSSGEENDNEEYEGEGNRDESWYGMNGRPLFGLRGKSETSVGKKLNFNVNEFVEGND